MESVISEWTFLGSQDLWLAFDGDFMHYYLMIDHYVDHLAVNDGSDR